MKLGIVSDSHGKTGRLRQAMSMLEDRGAEAVLHCGDLGDVADLEALVESPMRVYVVLGNTERHLQDLVESAGVMNVTLEPEVLEVDLEDGRVLVATHGNDEGILRELINEGRFAYLCHGHTHRRRDERVGKTRVINPGALYRAQTPSLALLDTASDVLEFIDLPGE